jgi:hypothetical protein
VPVSVLVPLLELEVVAPNIFIMSSPMAAEEALLLLLLLVFEPAFRMVAAVTLVAGSGRDRTVPWIVSAGLPGSMVCVVVLSITIAVPSALRETVSPLSMMGGPPGMRVWPPSMIAVEPGGEADGMGMRLPLIQTAVPVGGRETDVPSMFRAGPPGIRVWEPSL